MGDVTEDCEDGPPTEGRQAAPGGRELEPHGHLGKPSTESKQSHTLQEKIYQQKLPVATPPLGKINPSRFSTLHCVYCEPLIEFTILVTCCIFFQQ